MLQVQVQVPVVNLNLPISTKFCFVCGFILVLTPLAEATESDTDYDSPVAARPKTTIWDKLQNRFNLMHDDQPENAVCESYPLMISAVGDLRYLLY